jgi:hypothetical protein
MRKTPSLLPTCLSQLSDRSACVRAAGSEPGPSPTIQLQTAPVPAEVSGRARSQSSYTNSDPDFQRYYPRQVPGRQGLLTLTFRGTYP